MIEQKNKFEIFKATADAELRIAVQTKENEPNAAHEAELDELRKELEKYRELYYNKQKGEYHVFQCL